MNELASELLSVQAISEQDILLLKCPKALCDPITVMNLRHDKIKYKHRGEKMVNTQNQRKRQAGNGVRDNGPRKHELKMINKAIEEFKTEIQFIRKRFEMQMKPLELFPEDNEPFDSLELKKSKNCVYQNNSFRKWKNSMGATIAQENMTMKGEHLDMVKSNCQVKSVKMVSGEKFSVSEDPITEGLDQINTVDKLDEYSKGKYIKGETKIDEIQVHNVLNNSNTATDLLVNSEHLTNQMVHPSSNKLKTVQVSLESKSRILDKQKHAQVETKFTLCIKKSKVKAENGNISEDDITKFNQPSNMQIISKYYFMWKKYVSRCKFHQSNGCQNSSNQERCEHKMKIERLIKLLEKKKIEQKLVIDEAKNESFITAYSSSNKIRKVSATTSSIPNRIKADLIPAGDSCSETVKKTNNILLKYKLACEERDRLMESLAKARKIRKIEADNETQRRQLAKEVPRWVFNPLHIIETEAKERSKCRIMKIKQRKLRHEAEIQALLKEEQLRLEEEKSHLQFMSDKANKFHKSMLYKKYLLQPLNILASMRKLNYNKCESFRKKKLLHFHFNMWAQCTLNPIKVAQDFIKKCMLKKGYAAFLKVRIEGIQNNQVAMDFYDYFLIPHQAFTSWMKYHHIQIYKMETKLKISTSHYNRVLLRKYFSWWKIFHQDKELEARRNIWRMRVQEILPDFTPNIFCSRL